MLMTRLSGTAMEYASVYSSKKRKSYKALKTELMKRFTPASKGMGIDWTRTYQKENEKVATFVARLMGKQRDQVDDAFIREKHVEELLIKAFVAGLRKDLKFCMGSVTELNNTPTIQEAIAKAKGTEALLEAWSGDSEEIDEYQTESKETSGKQPQRNSQGQRGNGNRGRNNNNNNNNNQRQKGSSAKGERAGRVSPDRKEDTKRPQNEDKASRNLKCSYCGGRDHLRPNCPERSQFNPNAQEFRPRTGSGAGNGERWRNNSGRGERRAGGPDDRLCYNCDGQGHIARNCPELRRERQSTSTASEEQDSDTQNTETSVKRSDVNNPGGNSEVVEYATRSMEDRPTHTMLFDPVPTADRERALQRSCVSSWEGKPATGVELADELPEEFKKAQVTRRPDTAPRAEGSDAATEVQIKAKTHGNIPAVEKFVPKDKENQPHAEAEVILPLFKRASAPPVLTQSTKVRKNAVPVPDSVPRGQIKKVPEKGKDSEAEDGSQKPSPIGKVDRRCDDDASHFVTNPSASRRTGGRGQLIQVVEKEVHSGKEHGWAHNLQQENQLMEYVRLFQQVAPALRKELIEVLQAGLLKEESAVVRQQNVDRDSSQQGPSDPAEEDSPWTSGLSVRSTVTPAKVRPHFPLQNSRSTASRCRKTSKSNNPRPQSPSPEAWWCQPVIEGVVEEVHTSEER